jgi:hypothetical protein
LQCSLPLSDNLLNFSSQPNKVAGSVVFPSKGGYLKSIESGCQFEWVHDYKAFFKPGSIIAQTNGLSDVMCECVIVANSQSDFISKMHEMYDWVKKTVNWA